MKKILNILSLTILICCIAVLFTACTENGHKTITTDYAKLHNVDESEISFTCYAEFEGTHVLMLNGYYPDALSIEVVDGVVFNHSQIKTFTVYSNGEFYSLQEAFDSGLVTHDNLLTLREIYNG
ncbi:MAG: hypothetical protein HDP34_01940 [Clostridia bacterium]|nr:hypothetical protein [Clostridia bacterium]